MINKLRYLSILMLILVLLSTSAAAQSDPVYSGSWYNPARDGEGFHVEILGNGQALVIWFTYPGASNDAAATQAWILGVGTWANGVITIPDAYQASGPVFGDDFDKDAVQRTTWGEIKITFNGPNEGLVDYNGLGGQGSTQVTRLTNLLPQGTLASLPAGVSAAWYDPATDGQGWFVEILGPDSALVYWFTYDENGNPAWNLGVGSIYGNQIVLPDSRAGTGTRFGSEFVSSDISLDPFSIIVLEFTDCNTGSVSYLTSGGVQTGNFPLTRLTILKGLECSGLTAPKTAQSVMSNGSDPLLSRYLGLDNTSVGLFGRKTSSGRARNLQSGLIKTSNGQSISFELDENGLLSFIQDNASDVTLSTDVGEGGDTQIVLNDAANGVSSGVSAGGLDALQQARTKTSGSSTEKQPGSAPQSLDGGSVQVPVELCGEVATNAQVSFVLTDSESSEEIVLNSEQISPGIYQTALPTNLGPSTDAATLAENCDLTSTQFGTLCVFLTDTAGVGLSSADCLSMGQQIGVAEPGAAMNAAAACSTFRASVLSACAANEVRAGTCGADSETVFREFSSFQIVAEARFPGLTSTSRSAPVQYSMPGTGVVLPELSVTGRPYYKSHRVTPSSPQAGESYSFEVELGCVGVGQTLTIDNLTTGESSTCQEGSDGTCQAEFSSSNTESSHVLEISSPSGRIQRVVQHLTVDEDSGFTNGFWRVDYVDEGEQIRVAVGIEHPRLYYCEFSPDFREDLYLQWNDQANFYAGPIEDGVLAGIKLENSLLCAVFLDASSFDVLVIECPPSTIKVDTWSQATSGDGGFCDNFP